MSVFNGIDIQNIVCNTLIHTDTSAGTSSSIDLKLYINTADNERAKFIYGYFCVAYFKYTKHAYSNIQRKISINFANVYTTLFVKFI